MKYALTVTGGLAAIALAAPGIVVLGYVALIVPGLILTAAPTAFVYLAGAAVIRRLSPTKSPTAFLPAALCVALVLGWAAMQPGRLRAITAYESQLLPDVQAGAPLEIDGHVRIEMPHRRGEPECDYLCLALLDCPGVRSTTLVSSNRDNRFEEPCVAGYALEPAEADREPGLFPTGPGRLVREHPTLVRKHAGRNFFTAMKAVEADWAVRLSDTERLRTAEPVSAEAADWVIRFEDRSNDPTARVRRVTISDATGAIRFRRSYVETAAPARVFYLGFDVQWGAGMISNASFRVGRERLSLGDRSLRLEPALLAALRLPMPRQDAGAIDLLRQQVQQAMDDPDATPVRIDMARRYLGLFLFDANERDHLLIAQIVSDHRVRDLEEQLTNVYSERHTPVTMRDAFAKRIVMDHSSPSLRRWLAERLASLPVGAFAEPTATHLAIWETPAIYTEAAPFIARVADLGPARAVPVLEAALETALRVPSWSGRRRLVEGVRSGFARLGPGGAPAAAWIQELFLRRPSPILNNAGDADDWRFALARMGVAIDDLPFFPNQSEHDADQIRRRIADRLRRHEQFDPEEGDR
ncbi:hypothetical protein [Pirellulimonas nuda]|uniref:hypothetical protein n=1 Tax=Pirellulimonas nuda TaxID=2528009 RepID=UPI0011A00C4E|nr:hypothetical protein [Pirellulimonas nuda]